MLQQLADIKYLSNQIHRTTLDIPDSIIIPRAQHCVSRDDISDHALKVLYRLKNAGYAAFLVGGSVRDLLLRKHPKDFDVATDASPEQVKQLFRNCRLIGRRFRLAHVFFGREIIEVATFRGHHEQGEVEGEGVVENGMILRDNVFGTLEEDAFRRDFTVNALYYNIADFSIVDYTGGLEDLEQHTLRLIGDPEIRFQEDPVRMLRAIRFAAKLGLQLEANMAAMIRQMGDRLAAVPPARLFDEILKLFLSGHALKSYELLREYGLFTYMFGQSDECLADDGGYTDKFIRQAMMNTDARIHDDKPVTPFFLFAAMLWGPVKQFSELLQSQDMTELQSLQTAGNEVLSEQLKQVSIPKRFSFPMREIWTMQARLPRRQGKRAYRVMEQPRFRASYDFMLLRNQVGEPLQELCDWWTRFQEVDQEERNTMLKGLAKPRTKSQTKRRSRRRKSKPPV